ncbi:CLUMA_CG020418, isoform A [Clunio marinus]|uniref:CLUMA_CG020418, isoform A n=1 Tax=Clunio marinus TaxID=568069 RepID=A0A1J1J8Y1_9DIPT|nr:CLUMA_CG020418, isoform A [Clunio marinus]
MKKSHEVKICKRKKILSCVSLIQCNSITFSWLQLTSDFNERLATVLCDVESCVKTRGRKPKR